MLGSEKLDRGVEALEQERLRRAVLQIRLGALKNRLRHQDLVGLGDRLGPGGGVDDGADRRQVPMRVTELAKAEFAGMDADADTQLRGNQSFPAVAPVPMNV